MQSRRMDQAQRIHHQVFQHFNSVPYSGQGMGAMTWDEANSQVTIRAFIRALR